MILSVESVSALRVQLWDAGFRPVPIVNFDAPGPSPGKRPLGNDWRQDALKDPPFCVRSPAVEFALNTGLLCDQLRPIDIDIDDPAMAARVRAIAVDRFGEAPIRMRRNSPRCTILYRAAAGAPTKIAITGKDHAPGASVKVEVLGAGQQFVAMGRHDSGADLEWFPEAPGEISAEQLPAVTEEGILAFLTVVAALIGAAAPGHLNGQDHYSASEPQAEPLRVAAAVASIPNAGPADWEAWNRIGMAIWAATGGSGIGGELFSEWSKRHPAYDPVETEERWKHYRRSPPTSIGAGTLFHLAGGSFHPTEVIAEPPPAPSDDPGWWRSLEHNLLDRQWDTEVAEVADEPEPEPPPDLRDGLIINPPVHWLAAAPLRQWLIDQWIPIGYVTGLYGDGGVGKSLLAQQLLSSVALGLPWLGLTVRGGRAFGFMCEDDASELHRRQEGINRSYEVAMENLENLRISARLGFDNLLMTFDQEGRGKTTAIFAEICTFLEKFRPRLVVLDTLADIFGGDEIRRTQARQFVQGIGGRIAREYECAVVVPAHPSAAGLASGTGTSGSTAWNNTFRSRLYITRPNEDDGDTRLISRMKSNYAPTGGEITARWEHGAFANVVLGNKARGIPWPVIGQIFDEIERKWNAGDPYSSEPQTRNHGRFIGLCMAIQFGFGEKIITTSVREWMAGGYLKRDLADSKAKLWGLRVVKRLQPTVEKYSMGETDDTQ